jgi:hypothetical protein
VFLFNYVPHNIINAVNIKYIYILIGLKKMRQDLAYDIDDILTCIGKDMHATK